MTANSPLKYNNYIIKNSRLNNLRIVIYMSLLVLFSPPQIAYAVDIIVNSSIPENIISRSLARSIFGMRFLKWRDGTPIKVYVLEDNQIMHSAFCKEVLDIYPYQLRQSWDRLVYSGTGQAPTLVASEDEMLERVASTRGAIGYLKRSQLNDRIHLLAIQ